MKIFKKRFALATLTLLLAFPGYGQLVPMKYFFGSGKAKSGFTKVTPESLYSKDTGYGFWPGAALTANDQNIASDKPFYFSIKLPDGNYDVSITFGDKNGTSSQLIRTECRRLLAENFETKNGELLTKELTVHMRGLNIGNEGKKVLINPRETGFFHWDDQLTFEFAGKDVKVCALEIKPTTKATTVFLAGNSTVVDQDKEPWGAWGQMIPAFFQAGKVAIANYAESGETLLAFEREQRLEKIWSMAKPGDYLFIEFAHNDQKAGPNHLDPFTTYKAKLAEWIRLARGKGINPVIVTSMGRKNFSPDGKASNSLGDYPEAARQAGKENNVPVIDLNAMSMTMYTAWGPANAGKGFVDGTHANVYGAYELAKCIVEGIKAHIPQLAKSLKPGLPAFDPAHPDPFDFVNWTLSPQRSAQAPPGN
jgi:lysophospholipase L1-like esterase